MSNIFDEDRQYILNTYRRLDLEIVRGEGSYLYDVNGTKYLDMFSGIAVNNLGVNHPGIISRLTNQIDHYMHLSNYFVSRPVVDLAKRLVENSFASKVFFSNSGTEANEAAIKMARKYGRMICESKVEIVSAYNSFHGRTFGGMTLTGQDKYKEMFKPLMPEVKHFIFNDIDSLREQVSENTCAIVLEVIQGEGGIKEVTDSFMSELNDLSKQFNVLIVLDEIQTGLGRTGDLFAYEKFNIQPDIVTLSKSLGGGLPLGAMLVSEKLEGVLQPGDHGTTFGGNPVACALGDFVVETVTDKDFMKELNEKSTYLIKQLKQLKKKYPHIIKDIRGRGMMIGIEVGDHANAIKNKALEKQMLLNVTNSTVVRLLPALTISIEEINEFLIKFEDILKEWEG